MSYSLTDKAFRLITGSKEVSFVMITLAWYADHDKNQCFPSIDTLTKRCCMKRNTVVSSVLLLEKWGVINKQRRYRTSNIYTFSDKFVSVVSPTKDIFIEDFILQDGVVKVSPTALQLPKEELAQSIPNGTSISDSKYPKRYTNKVVKDLNKEDIKENPIIPCDEDEEANYKAQAVLNHYNDKFNCRYRDKKYFATLLKETKSRKAYTPDEIMLVIDWVAETWSFQPEPVKITRVSRFDGYLSQAEEWKANRIDYEMIVSEYNYVLGEMLGPEELTPAKKSKINKIIAHINKNHDPDTWNRYFCAAGGMISENPFYMGENNSGWVASFDWLMKPETLEKVRTYARQHAN
ncbi:helix-turn-helix domain-containing protein [Escherichia coli]|uniref:helix-turn-helix domain-containing protein n=1 Tax=Escherichia coli TaxID=562 RepID=UPI001BFC3373|nr:helix-turn-helix domain-containing protein [Escherichia coli]